MKSTIELKATRQKSYYGKAKVSIEDGTAVLQSYSTEVASVDSNGHFKKIWNGYSRTTANHINDFRRLFGLAPISKKEWDALPCDHTDRYKVELSNGFTSWTPSTTFDNETDAWDYIETVAEKNCRVFGDVIAC